MCIPQYPRRRYARCRRNPRHNYGCSTAGNTVDPDYPCLGATATHRHDRPLLDNSTCSAINDIAGLTDGQLPHMPPQTQVLSVTLLIHRCTIMSDAFSRSLPGMIGKEQHLWPTPSTPSLTSTYCC